MLSLKTHGRAGAQGSAPYRGRKKKKVKQKQKKSLPLYFLSWFLNVIAHGINVKMLQKLKKMQEFIIFFSYLLALKIRKNGEHEDCSLFLIRAVQADIEMHIETRCPNTAGYSSTSLYYSFIQILSAFQRQESTRRHTTGPHCALLGLIKTFFYIFYFAFDWKKEKRMK